MIRGRKERRRHIFAFSTLGSLYEHFQGRLPREEMVAAVREAISSFIPRDGDSQEESRLQLVRKCELSLRARAAMIDGAGDGEIEGQGRTVLAQA